MTDYWMLKTQIDKREVYVISRLRLDAAEMITEEQAFELWQLARADTVAFTDLAKAAMLLMEQELEP
jgi:hypothetical protein